MKSCFFLAIILFQSCQSEVEDRKLQNSGINKEDSLISTLIGNWGSSDGDVAIWHIQKDSIYFFEHSKNYHYEIVNLDMLIYQDKSKGYLFNIHVTGDTLIFENELGMVIKGFRK